MQPRASQAPRCLEAAGVTPGSLPNFSDALRSTTSSNHPGNTEAPLCTSGNGERPQEARTLLRVTQGIVTTGEVLEDSHLSFLPRRMLWTERMWKREVFCCLVFSHDTQMTNCPWVGWEEGYGDIVWKGGVTLKARRIFATIFCLLTPGAIGHMTLPMW